MRVSLKRNGREVGRLCVEPDGALIIAFGQESLTLTRKASRRIAGEVVRRSVEWETREFKGKAQAAARREIDRVFDAMLHGETGDEEETDDDSSS